MKIEISGKEVSIRSIEVEGVDMRDCPDFCDAFASYAEFKDGQELNEEQLEELNENHREEIYDVVINSIY